MMQPTPVPDAERIAQLESENATLREMVEAYEESVLAEAARADRLVQELKRSNADLDQFAYAASHDLKAPLRGIANLATWIEEALAGQIAPEQAEQFRLLRSRVRRMEDLINGMLEYSRVGRVRKSPEIVDTLSLARGCIDLLAPRAGIRLECAGPMPSLVTERLPLEQVLLNLVGNAIKYHDKPQGVVRISCEDAGEQWRFSVVDDGPGIPQEFHERIFGMFQRLESRDTIEGAGLGLALVRKIVQAQGGTVSLDSAPGKGAAFHFTWPKAPQ